LVLQPVHCVAPQTPGAQACVRAVGHLPEPSQNSGRVATALAALHEAPRHCLDCPGTVHAVVSTPSQAPSQPVPLPMQAVRGSTGLPVTAEHVPSWFGRLQASHCPTQSSLQHTPSTQKLVPHCVPAVHAPPAVIFSVHFPPAAQ
jgi:hypothetical protein